MSAPTFALRPNVDASHDATINAPRGRVVYADGWLYVRPGMGCVYAQQSAGGEIHSRAVGFTCFSTYERGGIDRLEAVTALDAFRAALVGIVRGYGTAALWADGIPVDMDDSGETGGLQHLDLDADALAEYRHTCARFLSAHWDDLSTYAEHIDISAGDGGPWDYAGHDLYLDSAGHGVSFTDRFPSPLIAACQECGHRVERWAHGPGWRHVKPTDHAPEMRVDFDEINAERAPLYAVVERLSKAADDLGEPNAPYDNGDGTASL